MIKPLPAWCCVLAMLMSACSGGTGAPVPSAAAPKLANGARNFAHAPPSDRITAAPKPLSENSGALVVSNLRDQQRDDTEPMDVSGIKPELIDDADPRPVR